MRKRLIETTIKYNKNNRGFTLVELLVVLVLMGILLGTVLFAGLGWQDWAQFSKEEAVAEDIFFAAQNQLTELDASGALGYKVTPEIDRMKALRAADTNSPYKKLNPPIDDVEYRTGAVDNTYDPENLWINSNPDDEKGELIMLRADAGDYDEYTKGTLTGEDKLGAKLLFDLVAEYVTDKNALNGSIILEFSPEAGQVFSVCYSDQADTLLYSGETASDGKKAISVMKRVLQDRRDIMLGYYSIDNLTQKVHGRSKNIAGLDFHIDNTNVLQFVVKDTKNEVPSDGNIVFDIYNENANTPIMTVTISVADALANNSLLAASNSPANATVVFKDNAGKYAGQTVDFRIPSYKNGDTYYFIFDAADASAGTLSYSKSIYFGDAGTDADKQAFQNTYSFYRFGISENVTSIYADVSYTASGSTAKKGTTTSYGLDEDNKVIEAPNGVCTTFSSYTKSKNDVSIDIKNMRHFYNMRYETDYKVNPNLCNTFNLKADLSWNTFIGKGGYLNSYKKTDDNPSGVCFYGDLIGLSEDDTSNYPFPGFRKLDKNDVFTQTDDTNYAISDLNITITGNIMYGVYGKKIKDDCYNANSYASTQGYKNAWTGDKKSSGMNAARAGEMPLGLFAENQGEIKNITLNRHVVNGLLITPTGEVVYTCMVGGFAGNNLGKITNLTVLDNEKNDPNSTKANISKVNGRTDVGGIIGRESFVMEGKDRDVTISNMKNYATVSGLENVGGIVGRAYTRYVDAEGDESFANVYGAVKYSGSAISSFEGIKDRYYRYHDGYKITDDYKSMTGDNVERCRYITIENCVNRGNVSGDEIAYDRLVNQNTKTYETGKKDTSTRRMYGCAFIGGIAGITMDGIIYDDGKLECDITTSDSKKIFAQKCGDYVNGEQAYVTVKNCNSYVLCDSVKAADLTSTSIHKALLYDDYVGGLIGYSKMTSIENCNTKPDSDMYSDNVPQTFVFGRSYVGGLIGCSDMSRFDISEEQNASQDGRDNYKYAATNYNNVIGVVSVGGIAGAFGIGDGQQESFNYSEPSTNECSMASQVYGDSGNTSANITRDLLNTGAVLCTKNKNEVAFFYVTNQNDSLFKDGFSGICGGITGMNRVSINNCDNIQSTEVKQFVTKLVFGDTNDHYTSDLNDVLAIDSENSKFGGNCSGGIVGYYNGNSRANTVEGAYSYVDAVVFGQNYVGGSFGISREGNKIYDLQNVYPYKKGNTSKGMLVIGQDIVGGLSGSLGRETSVEYDDPIEIPYTVKGRYAVGGITGIVGNNSANGTYYKITVEPESSVNVYGIGYVGGYCGVSTVNQLGTKNSKTVEISNMNLDGRYFTGGAYGVILDPSYVVKVDGENTTKDSIDFIKNIKIGSDVNVHSMIFAGGIAGLYTVETYSNNQDNVFKNKSGAGSLYNLVSNVCKDSASESYDSVVAADTNESNDIFDKTTDRQVHIEFEDYDNANTSSNIANVSAELFAGGLFGYVPNGLNITIKGFENNGNVNTTGKKTISEKDYSYLGGVMGRVSSGVKLVKCSNLKNGENYNSVASYLGGLTEVNAGVISGDVTTDGAGNVTKVDYTENRTNFEYESGGVGAFAGENNGIIQYCKNTAKVSANAGSAGGIAAVNSGAATIKYCVNTGSIGTDQSQKSAGIVAEPSGTDSITYCRNYGEIKGSSRYGIAAGSAGTITKNLEAGGLTEATALHDPISANSANSLVNNFYIDQNNGSSSGSGSSGSAIVPPTIENNEGIVTYNVTSVEINSDAVYEKTNKYNYIVDTWIGNSDHPLFKISYGISRSYGGDNNLGVKMSDFNIAWGAYNTTSNFVYCYDVIFTYNDANGTEQTTTVHRKDISLYGSTTIIDTIPAPQGVEITNVTLSMPYNEELKKHFPSGCNVLYKYAYWNDYNGKHFFMRNGENLSQNQDYISFDIKEQAGNGQVYNEWEGVYNSLYDSNPITNSSQLNNRKIWISGNDSYNSNRKITIDMDNSSTGHSMDYLKLYWYNEDAVNQKVYLYYVSFFYLDEDSNMQIVKYTRKFEGVPQDTFFYDKIPVTNENGNRIYPTSIVIDMSALDKDGNIINDNKYSHNYILGGITWIDINNNERKLENFDHKFKLNDTDRRSYVDIDTSVYIDGAPYLVSDSQQVDTDHWSKRLINVNNSGKYYLYFMRNGEQTGPITTDNNISYDVMSDGYNSQKRFEVYDNWFINEFIDSPTYFGPGKETYFVGTN